MEQQIIGDVYHLLLTIIIIIIFLNYINEHSILFKNRSSVIIANEIAFEG